jgi:predicted PP-loop superfamily ATPase
MDESPVMLCRLDDKLENEFETEMTDSYSIVVWTNGPSDYRAVTHATRHAVGIKNQLHAINATNGFTQLVREYQHLGMKLFQTHQYHGHVTLQTIPQYCMNQSFLFQTRSLGLWWFILLGDDAAVGSPS